LTCTRTSIFEVREIVSAAEEPADADVVEPEVAAPAADDAEAPDDDEEPLEDDDVPPPVTELPTEMLSEDTIPVAGARTTVALASATASS